jgi:methylated-DNA-[protein]-cysteine S-methyltransferase
MKEPQVFQVEAIATPTGEFTIVTDSQERLRYAGWNDEKYAVRPVLDRHCGKGAFALVEKSEPSASRRAIEAYFAGDVRALDALQTATGGTPFQRQVWAALRRIPSGETCSYGHLAAEIGHPTAVRAVGLANGANPIAVVVPCHRVIGADGTLTGYGGGLERKRWLIDHERAGAARRAAA